MKITRLVEWLRVAIALPRIAAGAGLAHSQVARRR